MDNSLVKKHLMEILVEIQNISGEVCPPLDGATKPILSLPKFNSKVWPVAAGMLSKAIGEVIPPEANIFFDENTKQALTIDQSVALVCHIIEHQKSAQVAAE